MRNLVQGRLSELTLLPRKEQPFIEGYAIIGSPVERRVEWCEENTITVPPRNHCGISPQLFCKLKHATGDRIILKLLLSKLALCHSMHFGKCFGAVSNDISKYIFDVSRRLHSLSANAIRYLLQSRKQIRKSIICVLRNIDERLFVEVRKISLKARSFFPTRSVISSILRIVDVPIALNILCDRL